MNSGEELQEGVNTVINIVTISNQNQAGENRL